MIKKILLLTILSSFSALNSWECVENKIYHSFYENNYDQKISVKVLEIDEYRGVKVSINISIEKPACVYPMGLILEFCDSDGFLLMARKIGSLASGSKQIYQISDLFYIDKKDFKKIHEVVAKLGS